MNRVLLPEGWPKPKGYANGISAEGRIIFVSGQVGWNTEEVFPQGLGAQFRQTLENTLAVIKAGDAGPEHIVRMTWYITDKAQYKAALPEIGAAWRDLMGKNYPCIAVVFVTELVEDDALIEIETTAAVSNA